MPKIKYRGPFDSVTLAVNGVDVAHGKTVEVDDETYASLIEQTDWVAVESKSDKAEEAKK